MAHKKGVGSTKNGRDSESKRLGVKRGVSLFWPATSWSVSAAPTSMRVRASASAAMTPCSLWSMAAFTSSAWAVTASAARSSSKKTGTGGPLRLARFL